MNNILKSILNLNSLINPFDTETIIVGLAQAEKKEKNGFIVEVDDRGLSYIHGFADVVSSKGLDPNEIKNTEFGDLIVFKKEDETTISIEYIDRRKYNKAPKNLPTFKLTENWFEILRKLDVLTAAPKKVEAVKCPLCGTDVKLQSEVIIKDGEWLDVETKVSIFTNFVKVGYNVYHIYQSIFSNERYIRTKDGVKFLVKKDKYGKKYLQLS